MNIHSNSQPSVSVIMTVYNTERYLKDAIESILIQTLCDFELIIVDDGSTDNSHALLRDLAAQDKRIKLIYQTNAGIGAATRRAIEESKGSYIAIMDSDDISLPKRLALQKQFLDKHPIIDAVGSQWRMLGIDGQNVGTDTHPTDPEIVSTLMYAYFSLHHPTTMIRREAILKVGGYSADRSCLVPDYDIFMRMQLEGCKFANLPEILFIWRLNPDSTTHSRALRQTESVSQVRDIGFAQLLKDKPEKANFVAKTITYNFPTGTWQDHKIKQLCPEQEESLLYRTWKALPTYSAEEQFSRTLILWLNKPQEHFESLQSQLINNDLPWLASLLVAYHGQEQTLQSRNINLPERIKKNAPLISLFIPFISCVEDFTQRLEQAIDLKRNSEFDIELIVFSSSPVSFNPSIVQNFNKKIDLVIIQRPWAWEIALSNAQGLYFMYLEENFRFNIGRFVSILNQIINDKVNILYLIEERYFTDAVDDAGKPLLDNSPTPTWSLSTLLGKDRINLTNFIHNRSLLNYFKGDFKECGQITGRVLARHLAIRNSFTIVTGAVRYFISGIHLNGQPLPIFQKTLLYWYYDFGITGLPAPAFWPILKKNMANKYAQSLSEAWVDNNLSIHPGNGDALKKFYLGHVVFPMRWPLFRHILLHNKKTVLIELWIRRLWINALLGCIYCLSIVVRNRCISLLKI